ncbi:MAG: response regulator transcription factor [Xanthomonadales bacterium]|nr:response regulator transcription factor [Xanthomonadales bacterium]
MDILIADDHPLFRDALKRAVSRVLPQAALHETDSVPGLQDLAEAHPHADLLLLDLNIPGAQGFSALVHFRSHYPQLPVVVVSAREESSTMQRAIRLGASGFIPKSASLETIAQALTEVLEGAVWLPGDLVEDGEADVRENDLAARIAELTPQQFRVLAMLGEGLLNKQIAWQLGVSEATIKAHMTAVLRKLGATNRTQAILMVRRLSLDSASDGGASLP